MPDVSSLLSSWKAERENDAFPLPCLEGVVLREKTERREVFITCKSAGDELRIGFIQPYRGKHKDFINPCQEAITPLGF